MNKRVTIDGAAGEPQPAVLVGDPLPKPAPPQLTAEGIAILGSHPATVSQAPFDKPWLIYTCSPHNFEKRQLPRWDEWFEVHVPLADRTRAYPYLKWLETVPLVWMRDADAIKHFPGAKLYPEQEMKDEFGPFTFTSSIAFILAKAIKDCETNGIKQIGLWGIMQASPNEFCAAPATRALTADLRWAPIGDLKVGDDLIAFDEYPGNVSGGTNATDGNPFRKWRAAKVTAASELTLPCYRFVMADGTELVSSVNHKWLNNEGSWIESRHVRANGDYPGATRIIKLLNTWTPDRSWRAGYLAAAVDGEGHLTQYENSEHSAQFRVGYAQRRNAMRAEVLAAAKSFGFEFGEGTDLNCNLLGGKAKTLEFLGRFRPPRLLSQLDHEKIGTMNRMGAVPVEHVEFVGDHPVIGLATSTETFIAEGFASHNTYQRPGIQNLIWQATKRGIKVVAPRESRLFDPPPEDF